MHVQFIPAIKDISAEHWNLLAGSDYPFLRHEFLSALEHSGVVTKTSGWQPQHMLIFLGTDLIAACPLYLKFHSQGEYVFDQQWANAYQQHGLAYYPKGLTAIPFTPCPGQRIMIKQGINEFEALQFLLAALAQYFTSHNIASWHCLFTNSHQTQQLQEYGLLIREGVQFQWFNRGYRDFQDYTDSFNARKRKSTLRERKHIHDQGIELLTDVTQSPEKSYH